MARRLPGGSNQFLPELGLLSVQPIRMTTFGTIFGFAIGALPVHLQLRRSILRKLTNSDNMWTLLWMTADAMIASMYSTRGLWALSRTVWFTDTVASKVDFASGCVCASWLFAGWMLCTLSASCGWHRAQSVPKSCDSGREPTELWFSCVHKSTRPRFHFSEISRAWPYQLLLKPH